MGFQIATLHCHPPNTKLFHKYFLVQVSELNVVYANVARDEHLEKVHVTNHCVPIGDTPQFHYIFAL